MTDQHTHEPSTYGANAQRTSPGLGVIGWMLLPLVPSIIFVVYFLVSGKILT